MKGFFITGTDTDCGKTKVACALIEHLRAAGNEVAPFKPVAAGAELIDGAWRNADALKLLQASGGNWDYASINPYCLFEPVSPHIAAAHQGLVIDPQLLLQKAEQLQSQSDLLVVEGAGGWHVPLGPDLDIAQLASEFNLPVILVVGLRLGCLNHALLSAKAIAASKLSFFGWVGSLVDPDMARVGENVTTLAAAIDAPCLGVFPHLNQEDTGSGLLCLEGVSEPWR